MGLEGPLRPPYPELIEALNDAGAPILAIDVPSGLHTDTGNPLPVAVRATVTATMAAPKLGFAPGTPGAAYAGRVVEVDIGLPAALHEPHLRDPLQRG